MTFSWRFAALWLCLATICAAATAYWQWAAATARFESAAAALHRSVSQRADQHDAHLTALSALIASGEPFDAALKAVATNILQFYPRIEGIDVVAVRPAKALLWSQRDRSAAAPVDLIAGATSAAPGKTELVSTPSLGSHYLLVKRVPSETSLHRLVSLDIDARRLLESDAPSDFSRISLGLADGGGPIYEADLRTGAAPLGAIGLRSDGVVASASQPLQIVVERMIPLAAILPFGPLAAEALAAALAVLLLRAFMMHRAAAREAVRQAEASAQEARLAHATRINSMGELSLAIAHELAQPLAAILSQSQAGLRMLKTGGADQAAIEGVLQTNARVAKRAGDLLARLRGWVSVDAPTHQLVDVNLCVREIADLNRAEFAGRGVDLRLDLLSATPVAWADRIGLEQIIQNLIANARDASPGNGTVVVATYANAGCVGFTVTDEGPGIPSDLAGRLFEPFSTSKSHGMGLGLSISRRLIEKFGGQIRVGDRADGRSGVVMTVDLPAVDAAKPNAADKADGAALSD